MWLNMRLNKRSTCTHIFLTDFPETADDEGGVDL